MKCSSEMANFTKEAVEAAILSSCATIGVLANLKDKQKEAIMSFVQGNDVLVILPTGYGKSLCYTLSCIVSEQKCISFRQQYA